MRFNKHIEPSITAWVLRLLMGPASIVDGVVAILSFGFVSAGFTFEAAKALSKARILAKSSND